MTERKKPTWDTPTPEQIRANVEAVLKNEPGMRGIIKFHGAFKSPMLVSEIPGHRGRINAAEYVFVQPKMDGHCCMANTRTRKIYTRSGHEITTLPHINAALVSEGPEWLHGELWKDGATSDSVGVMINMGWTSLELHVFDCVSDEGFEDRFFYYPIQDYLDGPIKYVRAKRIAPNHINYHYARFINDGYEGIIIRLDGHGYYHGRSQNVFKMKPGTEVL